jgi:hypothetical protein
MPEERITTPPAGQHVTPEAPPAPPAGGAAGPVHPEVRHETSDVPVRPIVTFVVGLLVAGVLIHLILAGLFVLFRDRERVKKEEQLPGAAVDTDELPPVPLEGAEDVRRGRFRIYPPRAAEIEGPEKKRLEEGYVDPKTGKKTVPIGQAIDEVAGKLKARREAAPPGANHERRLPSRASSGRTTTGGQ